jgi:hypothetical protein
MFSEVLGWHGPSYNKLANHVALRRQSKKTPDGESCQEFYFVSLKKAPSAHRRSHLNLRIAARAVQVKSTAFPVCAAL